MSGRSFCLGSDAAVNIQMSHHRWMVWAITAPSFTCPFLCATAGRLQSSASFPHPQKEPDTPGINSKLKRILPVSPRSLIHLPVCHFNSYFYGGTVLIGLLLLHDNSRPSESLTKGARPEIKKNGATNQSWEGNLAIMQHNRANLSFTTCSVCGHAGKMSWKPKVAAEEKKK